MPAGGNPRSALLAAVGRAGRWLRLSRLATPHATYPPAGNNDGNTTKWDVCMTRCGGNSEGPCLQSVDMPVTLKRLPYNTPAL
jgi:hypothetical protein